MALLFKADFNKHFNGEYFHLYRKTEQAIKDSKALSIAKRID